MSEAIGRIRFESARRKDGTPHPFGYGMRAVCDHCGATLRVQRAEIVLHSHDYPTALLTVAAADVDGVMACVTGIRPGPHAEPSAEPQVFHDSVSGPFPADTTHPESA